MTNSNQYIVRAYTQNDLEQAVDLFVRNFKNPPFNYTWMKRENIVRYFNDLLNTPMFYGFVCCVEDKIVGLCMGVVQDYLLHPSYDIKEILIDSAVRGNGVGTFFLTEVEASLENVTLVTISTQRGIPAFDFYKKNDYLVSEGTVFMAKVIN